MGPKAVAVVMTLVLAVAVFGVACGGEPDKEAIATEVAEEWVKDRMGTVSKVVAELLLLSPALKDTVGRLPGAESLVAGLVSKRIGDKVTWSYSAPIPESQTLYRVTATTALEMEIDLPLIGERAFAVTLPFNLLIDTDARAVEEWGVDLANAAVASY